MTTIFKTENSLYELDSENSRIRRIYGTKPSTGRQGFDNEWRQFMDTSELEVGRQFVIIWDQDPDNGFLRTTVTSVVTRIGDPPLDS